MNPDFNIVRCHRCKQIGHKSNNCDKQKEFGTVSTMMSGTPQPMMNNLMYAGMGMHPNMDTMGLYGNNNTEG